MNVVIYTTLNNSKNIFVNALIPEGIALYQIETPGDLPSKIQKVQPEIVVIDAIQGDFEGSFAITQQIKSSSQKTGIILFIKAIDKPTIEKAVQVGVVGFIKNDSDEEVIFKYIVDTYQKVIGAVPEQKHVRIKIDPKESIAIKFRSPVNSQLIMGQIKDISYGGVAMEITGAFSADSLTVGAAVNKLSFTLDSKDIAIDADIVAYQKTTCAFRFKDMTSDISEAISQWIFKKSQIIE